MAGPAENDGGGAISKEGVGDQFLGGKTVGQVEGAELDTANQHAGAGIGQHDLAGDG